MMNKIIGAAVLLLCFCSCVKDNDAIYYPVGNTDLPTPLNSATSRVPD